VIRGLSNSKNGIIQAVSGYSFDETIERLRSIIVEHGLTIFAMIDFSGDASRVGLDMKPTRLFIFGNPKAGTPLMVVAPTLAIDFPLKTLVAEDENGKVIMSYNSIDYLKERHNIPEALLKNVTGIVSIVDSVSK